MAFEADCGSSTVLEEFRAPSTARFLVPGETHVSTAACLRRHLTTSRGPRDEALHDSATPTVGSR